MIELTDDLFAEAWENASDALLLVDESGFVRAANACTEALLGYSAADLVGEPVDILVPERLRETHAGHRAGYMRHSERRPMGAGRDLVAVCKDGTERPVDISLAPLTTTAGVFVSVAIRDISHLDASQGLMRESLLRASPDLVMRIRSDGTYLEFRPAADHSLRMAPEHVVGKTVWDILPHDVADAAVGAVRAALDTGTVQQLEYRLPYPEGELDFETRVVASGIDDVVLFARDVTDRKQVERDLRLAEERYESLYEHAPDMYATVSLDTGTIVECNQTMSDKLGFERGSLVGRSLLGLCDPATAAVADDVLVTLPTLPDAGDCELHMRRRDGSRIDVILRATPVAETDGAIKLARVSMRDVTERNRVETLAQISHDLAAQGLDIDRVLERTDRTVAQLIERVADLAGVTLIGSDGDALDPLVVHHRFEEAVELLEDVLANRPHSIADRDPLATCVRDAATIVVEYPDEAELRAELDPAYHAFLDAYGVSTVAAVPLTIEDQAIGALFVARRGPVFTQLDVEYLENVAGRIALAIHNSRLYGELAKTRDELWYEATHDNLTGLVERAVFIEETQTAIARLKRHNWTTAVLYLDIDRLKAVNDTYGHRVGDRVLREIAGRLREVTRPSDVVARFSGDEFIILLEELEAPIEAVHIAQRMQSAISAEMVINGRTLEATASVGIAFAAGSYDDAEAIIQKADIAMYRAKQNGKNNYEVYDAALHKATVSALEFEDRLRGAVGRSELSVVYQPEIAVGTRSVERFEALLRWHHPEIGVLRAAEFIETAERSGLIAPIGLWVLREACHQLRDWRGDSRSAPANVAINLSAKQLDQSTIVEDLLEVLDETGTEPEHVSFEITETALLRDADAAAERLAALRDAGIHLAIDDFGAGYTSLSHLLTLPIDRIKIDRRFVAEIGTNDTARAIVRSLIDIAHSLDLTVTAEGVESQEQFDALGHLECDFAQGYFIAEPTPPHELRMD